MRLAVALVLYMVGGGEVAVAVAVPFSWNVSSNSICRSSMFHGAVLVDDNSVSALEQQSCTVSWSFAQPHVQAFSLLVQSMKPKLRDRPTLTISLQSYCGDSQTLLNLSRTQFDTLMYTFPYQYHCYYTLSMYQNSPPLRTFDVQLVVTALYCGNCSNETYYQCQSGELITDSLQCDGNRNCADWSDENWCLVHAWGATLTRSISRANSTDSTADGLEPWAYALIGLACTAVGIGVLYCILVCLKCAKTREPTATAPPQGVFHNNRVGSEPAGDQPPSYEQAMLDASRAN